MGVGILYTPGMMVQQATRPPQDEEMLAPWESGRWLHAHMAHGEGRSILNVQAQKYPVWVRLAEHYPGNGPK